MSEMESTPRTLFDNDTLKDDMDLVIEDNDEKHKYLLDEIKNKVIWGDTFKVLKK